jgi:hypothetical protein
VDLRWRAYRSSAPFWRAWRSQQAGSEWAVVEAAEQIEHTRSAPPFLKGRAVLLEPRSQVRLPLDLSLQDYSEHHAN